MTIPNTARKAGPLLGTGSQTAWPFTFKVFAAGDVQVTTANSSGVETLLVLGTDYTVTLNSNQDTSPGGTVNYPISGSALPVGSVLAIVGDLDYDQPLDLPSGGNFSPTALENQLDRSTMQIQQLREEMNRTAKLPPTSSESVEDLVDDLQRIADSADNLDTVAENITSVNVVAADLSEPVSEINTVATSIANVNIVGNNIANVNTVAGISANVTTVAGIQANVTTVAGIAANVTAVAGNATNINAVAGNATNINAVAANETNIDAVAANEAAIDTVAGISAAVSAVAAIDDDVTIAAANVADITNFADVYLGPKTSDPALRNDGSVLQVGDLYFNTVEQALRTYGGTQWVAGTAGTMSVQNFSGNGSTTAFTLNAAPASENNTQVYIGGVYQQKDQYSVSGTTLTFANAPTSGTDNIEVVTISTLALGTTDATLVGTTPGTGGLWSTVQGFINQLVSSIGSSLVGFIQAGTGAVARTAQAKLRESVSVKDFGAVGDGVTDDTAAIQDAINSLTASGGTVFFPKGTYKTDGGITLVSNLTLQGEAGAVLKPSASVPLWAYRGLATNNVKVKDLAFEGTGTAFTDGNQQLLHIANATNVEVSGCNFTKARVTGLGIAACDAVHISNCNFKRNYYYGADVRDSSNTTTDSCVFELNGDTGTATTAFGRGFVFWKCSNSTISNSVFHQNTEYGLRLYSQTGDSEANRNIAITGCTFRDNGTTAAGKNDLYVYNEHGGTERVAISGCTFSVRTGNFGAVLSGNTISLTGCTFKGITPQQGYAVSLYGSTNVVVAGNVFVDLSYVASFSATSGAVSTNCTLSNNQCVGVATFTAGGVQGTGHIISNNNIKHGGAGASDVGIALTSANISATITGNVLDGFYRAFNLASTGDFITIKDNRTVNSTGSGCFAQYQTDVSKIICTNNSFDSAYPVVWATMFFDSAHSYGRKFFVSNSTPVAGGVGGGANITWKVGDRVFNSAPAVGSPKSWVCTVAGAPGTWVSEGNL